MWIHIWKGAVLITKAGRIVVPAVIVAVGAVGGYLIGRRGKNKREGKPGGKMISGGSKTWNT